MFIIEYVNKGKMCRAMTSSPILALAIEELLISLPNVTLVIVWGVF